MKYVGYAILILVLWVVVSFVHSTLWPSGPDAWTRGVDTSTWWQGPGQEPSRAPPPRPKHEVHT